MDWILHPSYSETCRMHCWGRSARVYLIAFTWTCVTWYYWLFAAQHRLHLCKIRHSVCTAVACYMCSCHVFLVHAVALFKQNGKQTDKLETCKTNGKRANETQTACFSVGFEGFYFWMVGWLRRKIHRRRKDGAKISIIPCYRSGVSNSN